MGGLYLGNGQVKKVYVGSTEAKAVYLGSTKIWSAGPAIGDSYMGGYYAGIIDTTKGNIESDGASQTGLRYQLIVAGAAQEASDIFAPSSYGGPLAAFYTRWDGLTATGAAMDASNPATNFPAASYCSGLSHDSDGASDWYLPTLDELELVYRNFKPSTESNLVYLEGGSTFPTANVGKGYNPSSDPTGSEYTTNSPSQTGLSAFQSSAAQALSGAYWTSTTFDDGHFIWIQNFDGDLAGNQAADSSYSTYSVRPVRRLVLS